jgi:hypothetical protein
VADAGAVGAVHFRLDDGLAAALERRYVIGHESFRILWVPAVGRI